MKKICLLVSVMTLWVGIAVGQLSVPSVIGDRMVVKQKSDFRLWGWGTPGAAVVISNTWNKETATTKVDESGAWETVVKTPSAGGPYEINIRSGQEELNIRDVLSGEIWMCCGQSNMEWNGERGLKEIKEELPACNNNQIRFFYVDKGVAATPLDTLPGKWVVCDAASLNRFSAIGYFFGKTLWKDLKCPVGLINSNWGGTAIEFWMPEQCWADERMRKLGITEERWIKQYGKAYNAMIHPLRKYSVSGVLWYQGESNVSNASGYSELLTSMIGNWRKAFQQDFPFYFVQIAPYARCQIPWGTTLVKEQLDKTLAVPKTGMVIVTDLVADVNDIHPWQKKEVGQRLAALAGKEVYGKGGNPYSPRYASMKTNKDKVVVSFTKLNAPLIVKGETCVGFEVAGENRRFYPASAVVGKNKVTLSAKEVEKPVAVRFGFGDAAIGNLFGANGLPMTPFRTDNWPLGTDEK